MELPLTLNGKPVALQCDDGEMLLGVLRRAGMRSVRATCGVGVCGACTVLVDGELASACIMLAGQARGRRVETAESVPAADPVQRAFADCHAYQCGYCTPGFVLTARRLLDENPDPSPEAIDEALAGNLCRCGSYLKIADAVRQAAAERRAA